MAASCVAIMMSVKYWNMSILGLWVANSTLFMAILGWWALQYLKILARQHIALNRKREFTSTHTLAQLAMLLVLLGYLSLLSDTRNPSLYGLKAYAEYPSLLVNIFSKSKPTCTNMSCATPAISPEDITLITSLSGAKERVAIYSPIDWAYLVEAKRSPHFEFLPSNATFTWRQVHAAATDLDLIFLPKTAADNLGIDHPELAEALIHKLKTEFEIAAVGADLVAWKRTLTKSDVQKHLY